MDATVAPARPSGPWQATLPGVPVSVRAARQFVRDNLAGCPRSADLAQAATELAANAVRWSAAGPDGTFTVAVTVRPGRARVEVTDPGPAGAAPGRGNGWGLSIVAAVTDRHGTRHGPGRACTAWAEADWPASDGHDNQEGKNPSHV
jgi:hypothetical protein